MNFGHLRHTSYDRQEPLGVFALTSEIFGNCNLLWCYNFCTGVTLFALVLHLNYTVLSQSEWSNFFKCIIRLLTATPLDLYNVSLGGELEALRVKCLAQEHNAMTPARV